MGAASLSSLASIRDAVGKLEQLEADAAEKCGIVGYPDEHTLVVALANSYGTKTIPARGFIQRGVAKARGFTYAVSLDTSIPDLLGKSAKRYADAIVEELRTAGSWAAPLDADTIAHDGNPTPLSPPGELANLQTSVT